MAKTSQELVTRVLQKLTQLQPGEDPSAEDDDFLTETWATINANLRRLRVSSWTDNSIPDEVFEPLAEYVKEYVWQEYKGPRDGNSAIVRAAQRDLRAVTALRYMGNPLNTEYF